MRLALDQAKRTLGNTKKNPAVGCVIVKNQHVISAGYTSIYGRPHAEQNAINFSKINLKNSELYVTLEPCSHFGNTPPCVNSIIKSKIKKVIFSINDPDPRSFNKCSKKLKSNDIHVINGILKNEIKIFYRSYHKSKQSNLPFVTCKLAISKDFYTINKRNKWITNDLSRGRVHLMRASHDCIMTSSKTIMDDNPRLTCRVDGLKNRSPSRIILDKKLNLPINSKIIKESSKYKTIIFYNKINKKKIKLLKKLKIKIFWIPLNKEHNLDLEKTLIQAKKMGYSRILIESGATLAGSFLNNNLVDDFKLFISNKNLKKQGGGEVKDLLKLLLKNKKIIKEKVNLFGDKLLSYKMK